MHPWRLELQIQEGLREIALWKRRQFQQLDSTLRTVMCLRSHASRGNHEDNTSNDGDDVGGVIQSIDEDGQDGHDARKTLQAVVEVDDLVVHGIRNEVELVHQVHSRRGNGTSRTAAHFHAQADLGHLGLAQLTALDASTVDVRLAAGVVGWPVLRQCVHSHLVLGTRQAKATVAEPKRVLPRSLQHGDLERVLVHRSRIVLMGITRELSGTC